MKLLAIALALAAVPALADVEDRSSETRTFPNASLVIVDNVNGSIEATGYGGSEVQVQIAKRIEAETPERLEAAKREVKLDVQSGETLKLYVDGPFRCHCRDGCDNCSGHQGYSVYYDFKLQIPAAARVDMYTVNHGHITLRGMNGGFEVRNVNGQIEMTDIGGAGSAHTVNGPVKVTFSRNPSAASSFETINGSVDLSFRSGLSANARMETMNGGMYTDFDVVALPTEPAAAENQNGKYVFRRRGVTSVRIGSGGPELRMKTLNGDIFIREEK